MSSNSSFTPFFEAWLARQASFLEHMNFLLCPEDGFDRNHECAKIIPHIFAHYKELYAERSRVADGDVFALLSPPWLTSFEKSLLWVAGFRPSMLFPIVAGAVDLSELSEEAQRGLEELRAETRRKEREISDAVARVQETAAEEPMYGLVRKFGRLVGGQRGAFVEAAEGMRAAMAEEVERADELRAATTAEVVGVLGPVQSVRFLAAVARFQINAREWGLERERESWEMDGRVGHSGSN